MEGRERRFEILHREVVIMPPCKEKKFCFSIGIELKDSMITPNTMRDFLLKRGQKQVTILELKNLCSTQTRSKIRDQVFFLENKSKEAFNNWLFKKYIFICTMC